MSIGKNLNVSKGDKGKSKKAATAKTSKKTTKEVKSAVPKVEEAIHLPVEQETSVAPVPVQESLPAEKADSTQAVAETAQEILDKIAEDAPMIAEGQNMLIVFPVGDEEYAIAIDDIREVVPAPPIAIIPQVPKYVKGVANVRGNVLAVLDLGKRFMKDRSDEVSESKFVLVIKNEEYHVAVSVDTVPTTMMVKDSEIDSPSNIISHSASNVGHIKGIIKEGKRMIVWINIHDVLVQIYENDLNI